MYKSRTQNANSMLTNRKLIDQIPMDCACIRGTLLRSQASVKILALPHTLG